MKALSIVALSFFTINASAEMIDGFAFIENKPAGSNYSCEVLNNAELKMHITQVTFNYTCNSAPTERKKVAANCTENCDIGVYKIKSFPGPRTCEEGALTTVECTVEYEYH